MSKPDPRDEELAHLRQGIAAFCAAYESATQKRPDLKRPAIEAWLETDRQRERARIEQEDRQRAEQTQAPTCAGRYGDT